MKIRSDSLPGFSMATSSSPGVELGQLLLDVILEVVHAWFGAKKKWARPTSRYRLGTEKLARQYSPPHARSGEGAQARPRTPGPVRRAQLARPGRGSPRRSRPWRPAAPRVSPVAVDQGDGVLGALKADRRVRDVVEDDQIGALSRRAWRGPGARPPSPCSAAKPTIVWPGARSPPRPARMSSVGSRSQLECASRPELARGRSRRRESRPARRPSAGPGSRRTRPAAAAASSAVVSTSMRRTPGGLRAGRRWRRSGSPRRRAAPPRRRARSPSGRWSGCR